MGLYSLQRICNYYVISSSSDQPCEVLVWFPFYRWRNQASETWRNLSMVMTIRLNLTDFNFCAFITRSGCFQGGWKGWWGNLYNRLMNFTNSLKEERQGLIHSKCLKQMQLISDWNYQYLLCGSQGGNRSFYAARWYIFPLPKREFWEKFKNFQNVVNLTRSAM